MTMERSQTRWVLATRYWQLISIQHRNSDVEVPASPTGMTM
jgi:hypothetical protein